MGRQDVAQKIVDFVQNNDFPIYRNPKFFEEYDISKEGHLTVIDANMWVNAGRPDVAEDLAQIITGQLPMPVRKNPQYFEDFDRNLDGTIDVLDINSWNTVPGLPELQKQSNMQKTSDIILGNSPTPLYRNPLWFQDYDLNGDGMLDIRDVVIWVNAGRPEIAERVSKFITGEIEQPPIRY